MTPDKSAFNKTPPGGCQTDDLYLIHGLFRNAFRHAPLMVSSASQADPGRVSRVAAHLDEVLTVLHGHHQHEDTLWWEAIKERAPEAREDVERMAQSHQEIEFLIQPLRDQLRRWQQAPEAQEALVLMLREFEEKLETHLTDEEQHIKPVAARVLSQAEWDEAQKRGMAETPKERLFFTLGYLRRGAPTEALRADFWGKLPLPARLIYRLFWKKKFEREWADLYGQAQ